MESQSVGDMGVIAGILCLLYMASADGVLMKGMVSLNLGESFIWQLTIYFQHTLASRLDLSRNGTFKILLVVVSIWF